MTRRRKKKIVKPTARNPWPKLLAEFRERHDLTQPQAAALAKVTDRSWKAWENGERAPNAKIALLLALVIEKKDAGKT